MTGEFRKPLGQFTLVLGAGVSYGLVPGWNAFTGDVVEQVAQELQIAPDTLPGVALGADGSLTIDTSHPLGNEALLEICWQRLRDARLMAHADEGDGWQRWCALNTASRRHFADLLRRCLYPDPRAVADVPAALAANRTLKVLTDVLTSAHASRIASVITFNIDDWLERALHHSCQAQGLSGWGQRFSSIPHPTYGPVRSGDVAGGAPRLPIFHLHGLLTSEDAVAEGVFRKPRQRLPALDAPSSLVFTEEQYWEVSSTPAGFANHIMQSALSTSHCLFLGLSMRDINILRWLGLRGLEHERSFVSRAGLHFADADESVRYASEKRFEALIQHYWMANQPDAILQEILARRGVITLETDFKVEDEVRAVFARLGLAA